MLINAENVTIYGRCVKLNKSLYTVQIRNQAPVAFLDLMAQCWQHDPSERPTADEIVRRTLWTPSMAGQVSNWLSFLAWDTGFAQVQSVSHLACLDRVDLAAIGESSQVQFIDGETPLGSVCARR